MTEKYLVVNGGSSSLKFSLYERLNNNNFNEIVSGNIQKIGLADSFYVLKINGNKIEKSACINNHVDAVNAMFNELLENGFVNDLSEIKGVGNRVVHGGEYYSESVLIDDEALNNIKSLSKFSQLHQPAQVAIIEFIKKILPNVPQIATFDTAFHQSLEDFRYLYPIKNKYYNEYGIRKYGFHGTSCDYITNVMKDKLCKNDPNIIICHIGGGASITAVKDGKSLDTSMGLTPLDGLMMEKRSGSIDPEVVESISKQESKDLSSVINELNNESGLLGICGKSDLRDIEKLVNQGDKNAIKAMQMYTYSFLKVFCQMWASLKTSNYFLDENDKNFNKDCKVDAIVFTAGGGENNIKFREDVINALSSIIGSKLNKEINDNIAGFKKFQEGIITTPDSLVPVYVIPTDEEHMILTDTVKLTKEYNEQQRLILK